MENSQCLSYITAGTGYHKKRQVNNTQLDFEFEAGNNKKYEIDGIWDSTVYAKKSATGQLPGLYYLVLWKGYPEKENTWEPVSAI